MRPVDGDALLEKTKSFCASFDVNWTDDKVLAWIGTAPTIDYEPVRYGEWVPYIQNTNSGAQRHNGFIATCCGEWNIIKTPRCPQCGAKMKKGE